MILHIDASDDKRLVMSLSDEKKKFKKTQKTNFNQAEVFFVLLEELLDKAKMRAKDIKKIKINSSGKGFSSLRIAISSANALAFWLGIEIDTEDKGEAIKTKDFSIIKPKYEAKPNIG